MTETMNVPPNSLGIERISVRKRPYENVMQVYISGGGLEWGSLISEDASDESIAEEIRLCLIGFKRGRKRADA